MSIDYWSIGIIMYELYFGSYPFGQNANDPMDVYREILKKYIVKLMSIEILTSQA